LKREVRDYLDTYDNDITIESKPEHLWKKNIMIKYDTTSRSYDELYGKEQNEKYRVFQRLISEIKGVLLDAGCGTSLLLEYLMFQNVKVMYYVGVDISIGMLYNALNRIKRLNASADLIQADIEYLPIRNKAVDTIASITVVSNLYNVERGVKELERCLKNPGTIVISTLKDVCSSSYMLRRLGYSCVDNERSKDVFFYKHIM